MLVPDGGVGRSRQWRFTLRQLRRVLVLGVLLAVLAALGIRTLVVELPRRGTYNQLASENRELKARLQEVDATLAEVEGMLERLRLYDAQLRDVPHTALPNGSGPLDLDEVIAAEDVWEVLDLVDEPPLPGELGEPMDEPEEGARLLEASFQSVDATFLQVQRIKNVLDVLEPQLGLLVESGEDYRVMVEALPSLNPVPAGRLTSGYGYRRSPFTRRWKFHTGIDLAALPGTPIYAPADGVVETARWTGGYGRMLEIDHGYGVVSRFAHTNRIYVKPGKKVQKGERVASVGQTGQATGPHLHYEIFVNGERVDPLFYIPRDTLSGE